MEITTVRRHLYVHASSDENLSRRIDTFISALRVCDGSIVAVEHRQAFRGRRLAVIIYEFPLRHQSSGSPKRRRGHWHSPSTIQTERLSRASQS